MPKGHILGSLLPLLKLIGFAVWLFGCVAVVVAIAVDANVVAVVVVPAELNDR